jgi:hypothetical protein
MKKINTVPGKKIEKIASQKLTIGLDLGDRWSWYCVLNEAGDVVLEQKVATCDWRIDTQGVKRLDWRNACDKESNTNDFIPSLCQR